MTKQELFHHVELLKQLSEDLETLAAMRAAAYPAARRLDGMPRAPGTSDRVGDLAAEIADMEAAVADLKAEIDRSEAAAAAFISTIEDDQTRMIFRLRFIRGMDWKTVAKLIGGGNTAKGVATACYRYIAANLEPSQE